MEHAAESPEVHVGPGLVVLGMHRSGTSALTGILHLLGANLGKEMVESEPGINLKGYWENKDANQFDDRLLKFLGSDWYDVFDLPEEWSANSKNSSFADELRTLLVKNFAGPGLWAVKDPRLCRLFPLWKSVAEQQNVELKCLLVLRHPCEVAQSLKKRNGFEEPHSLLLWLSYVLDSEYFSRTVPRAIITYESLLTGWHDVFESLEQKLNLGICLTNTDTNDEINSFLDSRLRHHISYGDGLEGPILKLALLAYEALQKDDKSSLDEIRNRFNDLVRDAEPWLVQSNYMQAAIELSRLQFFELQKLSEYQMQIEDMKNSRSWRWTAPLRYLSRHTKTD